jgi:hypothetical protein
MRPPKIFAADSIGRTRGRADPQRVRWRSADEDPKILCVSYGYRCNSELRALVQSELARIKLNRRAHQIKSVLSADANLLRPPVEFGLWGSWQMDTLRTIAYRTFIE